MFNNFGFDSSASMMHMQVVQDHLHAAEQHQQMHQQTMEQHQQMHQQTMEQHQQFMHQQAIEQQQQFMNQQLLQQQRRYMEQQQWTVGDLLRNGIPRRRYAKRQGDPLDMDEVCVPSQEQTAAVPSRGLLSEMWHYLKRLCK